jgi:type IV secretory pathway VirB2 component (pilin)
VAERQEKSQMAGDFLREIAVLIIVFYPIDAWFSKAFDWSIFLLVAMFAFILLWWGMILEGSDEL